MNHILVALRTADQQAAVLRECNPWLEYERRKREFVQANPTATTEAYEAFINALTAELDL